MKNANVENKSIGSLSESGETFRLFGIWGTEKIWDENGKKKTENF